MSNAVISVKSKSKHSFNSKTMFKDISINSIKAKSVYNNELVYNVHEIVNADAIKNSLYNIFSWYQGERILDPEFGNSIYKYLYEKINDFTSEQIISLIHTTIAKYEPRVIVDDIYKIDNSNDIENNTINIMISYHIKGISANLYKDNIIV